MLSSPAAYRYHSVPLEESDDCGPLSEYPTVWKGSLDPGPYWVIGATLVWDHGETVSSPPNPILESLRRVAELMDRDRYTVEEILRHPLVEETWTLIESLAPEEQCQWSQWMPHARTDRYRWRAGWREYDKDYSAEETLRFTAICESQGIRWDYWDSRLLPLLHRLTGWRGEDVLPLSPFYSGERLEWYLHSSRPSTPSLSLLCYYPPRESVDTSTLIRTSLAYTTEIAEMRNGVVHWTITQPLVWVAVYSGEESLLLRCTMRGQNLDHCRETASTAHPLIYNIPPGYLFRTFSTQPETEIVAGWNDSIGQTITVTVTNSDGSAYEEDLTLYLRTVRSVSMVENSNHCR